MFITRIDESELAGLQADWNRLSAGVPFRSHEWLATWWQHYGHVAAPGQRRPELYTLKVVDDQGQIVALAPWYLLRSPHAGRVVRFLGSGEVCSDFLTVLCAPGCEHAVAQTLADWLVRASQAHGDHPDRWDVLDFSGTEARDAVLILLAAELALGGADATRTLKGHTWRIELPTDWDQYLAKLSKSHRKQLRQHQRRLLEGGRATLRTATDSAGLEQAWTILTHLHQRRLQSLGKAGCFASPVYHDFLHHASQQLLAAGQLRLHWLELEGRPIAAEYQLAGNDTVYAYQGGVEPTALQSEPGRLATLATLQAAIDGGFRAFDFCRGDESYKAHWRAAPQASIDWRIVANRSSARLRDSFWRARENARRLAHTGWHLARGGAA